MLIEVTVKRHEQSGLIEIHNVRKWYTASNGKLLSRGRDQIKAVDGVQFNIISGESLGLVGESGCGKTTLGMIALGLEKPTSGSVIFKGRDLSKLGRKELRSLRCNMQLIFQDPYDSLDPRMRIGNIIAEPLIVHGIGRRSTRKKRVAELLEIVGLSSVDAGRYPHEFSGGQRQRIGIARALALNPRFIVCDEPVSALDVSIQAQILNLLSNLKQEFNLTYLFIGHGLAVVKHISDRVAVMYLGKIVELAQKQQIFSKPRHPYTEALMSSIPIPDPTIQPKAVMLEGDVPSPINPPNGCRFHTRCSYAHDICTKKEPSFIDIGGDHWVACHLWNSH